ncbi:MAG: hypothetical protein ABW168_24920 [Sedimenticola sp.]
MSPELLPEISGELLTRMMQGQAVDVGVKGGVSLVMGLSELIVIKRVYQEL